MKKQLNTSQIANELAGGSAFFPSYKKPDSPAPTTPEPERPVQQPEQATSDRATYRPSDLPTPRPTDRPTGKRLLVRRGFEWYEDQLAALKKLSLQEQMEGKDGSMSAMVRAALDEYLKKRTAEK